MKKITEKRALAAMAQLIKETATIDKIKANYRNEQSELDLRYDELLTGPQKIADDAAELVERFFEENKEDMFDEKTKTVGFGAGKVSLKKTPPKLEIMEGFDAATVFKRIKKVYPEAFSNYIRIKESFDSSNLKKLETKQLKKLCLEVTQTENIIIKVG